MFRLITAVLICAIALECVPAFCDSWGEKRPQFNQKPEPETRARSRSRRQSQNQSPDQGTLFSHSPLLNNDILIGAKAGFQLTSFTDVTADGKTTPLPNGLGYFSGGSVFWNVGLPRLEADVVVHDRKQGDRNPFVFVGIPLLVKFAVAENSRVSWNAGTGVQVDLAVSGAGTKRNVALGLPVATDLLVRLDAGPYLDFELRYNFGMQTFDSGTTGGRPRDLDALVGFLVPIDRTGF